MNRFFFHPAVCFVWRVALIFGWPLAGAELPSPWQHQDIGAVEVKGDASYSASDRSFTIQGTLDTWGTNDGFHFVWRQVRGDVVLTARVVSVENTFNHAKGGLMFRESLDAGSKHAEACVTPVDGAQFLTRLETNGKTTAAHTGLNKEKFPFYLKLERRGQVVGGYESMDGVMWSLIGSTNLALPDKIYIGLVTSSHQKSKLCEGKFDHIGLVAGKP